MLRQAIHAHGRRNQRDIVHNRRDHADEGGNNLLVWEVVIEEDGKVLKAQRTRRCEMTSLSPSASVSLVFPG